MVFLMRFEFEFSLYLSFEFVLRYGNKRTIKPNMVKTPNKVLVYFCINNYKKKVKKKKSKTIKGHMKN